MTMLTLLAEAAVRATLIAAAVGLALRLARITTARLTHLAWASVAAAMLLQPALVAWAPRAAIPVLAAAPIERSAPTVTTEHQVVPTAVTVGATLMPGITAASPTTIDWPWMVAAVYVAGLILLLGRVALGVWHSRRLLAGAVTAGSHWVHPRCAVPLTFGLLAPRVVLPPDWPTWDADELAAVLAHEREHVRRRDTLIAFLALINRAIFWFHPLAWWLHRRMAELAEQACDEAVLAHGHDASVYAESLLRFARRAAVSRGRVQSLAAAMPGSNLSSRLEFIVGPAGSGRVSRVRRLATGLVCAVAIAAGSVTMPVAAQAIVMPTVVSPALVPQPPAPMQARREAVVAGVRVTAAEPEPPQAADPTPQAPVVSSDDRLNVVNERQLEDLLREDRALTDLSITAETSFTQLNRAEYGVPIRLRIASLNELARTDGQRARLDVIGTVIDALGNTFTRFRDVIDLRLNADAVAAAGDAPITYERSAIMLPGRYTLKAVVRDQVSGRVGNVVLAFTIPNLARQQGQ